MAKTKVTFRPVRNSDDDWTVVAEYPGAEPGEIVGFKSNADAGSAKGSPRRAPKAEENPADVTSQARSRLNKPSPTPGMPLVSPRVA